MAATLEQDSSGNFLVRFRFGGKGFKRSLKSKNAGEADNRLGAINEMLEGIEKGWIQIPSDAEPGAFIVSGGKLKAKPSLEQSKVFTIEDLFVQYETERLPQKRESTARTERTHLKNLRSIIDVGSPANSLSHGLLQTFIDKRQKVKFRGRKTRTPTIRKEIATLLFIWKWGLGKDLLQTKLPQSLELSYPRAKMKGKFGTWNEIQTSIEAQNLQGDAAREEWERLYLDETQILELLDWVRENSTGRPWLYPAVACACFTGMRRSEIARSRRIDFHFESEHPTLTVREHKRDTKYEQTTREVPLHPELASILLVWFEKHPGCTFAFSRVANKELTWNALNKALSQTLDKGPWKNVPGWHCFRHSFASNAARSDTSPSHIDEWLGHETEAMRRRYRHLFKSDMQRSMGTLYKRKKPM